MPNGHYSAEFIRLMDKRIREVTEGAIEETLPIMIPTLYNVMPSDSAFEEFYNIETIGDIPRFTGSLSFLKSSPGYYNRIEPGEYAAGLSFERKLIQDKKFAVLDGWAESLGHARNRTREKAAVRPFANCSSIAFDFLTSEEGVALASSAHLTKVPGVSTASGFSNTGTTALSKTAVAAARLAGKRFRVGNGELANVNLDTLLVPSALYDLACEITGYDPRSGNSSGMDPDAMNGKINVVGRGIKVVEWPFLDDYSNKNWFMVDSRMMKKFLIWIDREGPVYATQEDFHTFAIEHSIYDRFGYGWLAWQWFYASIVS